MFNMNYFIRMICLIVEIGLARVMDYERALVEAVIGQVGFTGMIFLMVFLAAFTLGIFRKHEATDR